MHFCLFMHLKSNTSWDTFTRVRNRALLVKTETYLIRLEAKDSLPQHMLQAFLLLLYKRPLCTFSMVINHYCFLCWSGTFYTFNFCVGYHFCILFLMSHILCQSKTKDSDTPLLLLDETGKLNRTSQFYAINHLSVVLKLGIMKHWTAETYL